MRRIVCAVGVLAALVVFYSISPAENRYCRMEFRYIIPEGEPNDSGFQVDYFQFKEHENESGVDIKFENDGMICIELLEGSLNTTSPILIDMIRKEGDILLSLKNTDQLQLDNDTFTVPLIESENDQCFYRIYTYPLIEGEEHYAPDDSRVYDFDRDGFSNEFEITHRSHFNPEAKEDVERDLDNDGLNDSVEYSLGSSLFDNDTDDDGLDDLTEHNLGTSLTISDTDNDGLSDGEEFLTHHSNPLNEDTDGDGLKDGYEDDLGSSISRPDTDNDGLIDGIEDTIGSLLLDNDTDDDGLIDGIEYDCDSSLFDADTDNDGLTDSEEYNLGTSLTIADTDYDGLIDSEEILTLSNEITLATTENPNNSIVLYDIACNKQKFLFVWAEVFRKTVIIHRRFIDNDGSIFPDEQVSISTEYDKDFSLATASNGNDFFIIWQGKNSDNYDDSGLIIREYPSYQEMVFDSIIQGNFSNKIPGKFSIASNNLSYFISFIQKPSDPLAGETFLGGFYSSEGIFNENKKPQFIYTDFSLLKSMQASAIQNDYVVSYTIGDEFNTLAMRLEKIRDIDGGNAGHLPDEVITTKMVPDITSNGITCLFAYDKDNDHEIQISLVNKKLEYKINENDDQDIDDESSVQAASNGIHYLVVWRSKSNDGNYNIYAQFYNSALNKIRHNEPLIINKGSVYENCIPVVAANGKDFLIAWQQEDDSGPVKARFLRGYGTNPRDNDSDHDGLLDWEEIEANIDPTSNDTDLDGLSDYDEKVIHETSPRSEDSDNDGISDAEEIALGSDPNKPDNDNDGLTEGEEQLLGTNLLAKDSDGDELSDGEEVLVYSTNPLSKDTEGDSLTDYQEIFLTFTSPLQMDSEFDGVADGIEYLEKSKEFTANSISHGVHSYPFVSTNGNTYFVVWSTDLGARYASFHEYGVYGRFFNLNGTPTGSEFLIENYTYSEHLDATVASNGENYLVVWPDNDGIGTDYTGTLNFGLYGQIMTNSGTLTGSKFLINTYTTDRQTFPSIASDGTNYLVVWQSLNNRDGNEYDIYGQIISSDGRKLGTEFRINTSFLYNQLNPRAAWNGLSYLVVWETRNSSKTDAEIYGQLVDENGNKIGGEIQINTYTTNYQLLPRIASDGENFFVTWHSANQDGGLYGVYGRIIQDNGVPLTPEILLSSTTQTDQLFTSVACDNATYLVVWASDLQDNLPVFPDNRDYGIYARRFDRAGNPIGDGEFRVNEDVEDDQIRPFVSSNGFNFFVVWQDEVSLNTYDVAATVYRFQDAIDPADEDSDDDTIIDGWEVSNYLNPRDYSDAAADNDNDGLVNTMEFLHNTNPWYVDTDGDTLTDYEEINTTSTDPANADPDHDGLSDYDEIYVYNTQPNDTDSDNDGLTDGVEISSPYIYEFPIKTITAKDWAWGAVASDSTQYLLTWSEEVASDSYEIHGRLINKNGFVNTSSLIVSYTYKEPASIRTASNGSSYLVVYPHQQYSYDIFAQLIDNDGGPVGTPFMVNTYTTDNQVNAVVASDGSGYLVVWQSENQDGSGYGIYGQRLDGSGNKIGTEFGINTQTSLNQVTPNVGSNGSYYFVTWEDRSYTTALGSGATWELKGRFIKPDGTFVNDEFQINTYFRYWQLFAAVGSDGNGFLSAWHSEGQDNSGYGIFAQYFDNDGNFAGDEFPVNTTKANDQIVAAIASNGSDYMVTWASEFQDGDSYGIFAQRLNSTGNKIGPEFQVNKTSAGNQYGSRIASDGESYLVLWSSKRSNGEYTLYGTLYWWGHGLNPNASDSDNDGLDDLWEISNNLNPHSNNTAQNDDDNDGLTNEEEYAQGTDPYNQDTDEDNLTDNEEVTLYGTNPNKPDTDNDGLTDYDELFTYTTSPTDNDSDDDGLLDGEEVLVYGTDPKDDDSDNDQLSDYTEVTEQFVPEFMINTSTANAQKYPRIAADGNRFLVTWTSLVTSSEYAYYGQFMNADGTYYNSEFLIDSYSFKSPLSAASCSNGQSYLVVYPDNDGDTFDLYAQLMNTQGDSIMPKFLVNTYQDKNQLSPAVATDGSNYLVVWQSGYGQDGDQYGIYAQFVGADGTKRNDEFQVNTSTEGDQVNPAVTFNGKYYLVTWTQKNTSGTEVMGQYFDLTGQTVGVEHQINTVSNGTQDYSTTVSDRNNFLSVWHSENADESEFEIKAQLSDNAGSEIGNEFVVNSFTLYDQAYPSVASNDREYLVTWASYLEDGESYGIFARKLALNTNFDGLGFRVNSTTLRNQQNPCVWSSSDHFLIAWESNSSEQASYDIYGALFSWGIGTDPNIADTDNDGLSDRDEVLNYKTNPANTDTDYDSLSDQYEILNNTNPLKPDSDYDLLSDADEVAFGSSPNNPDTDSDGASDYVEYQNGTDPLTPDSDTDGLLDGEEIAVGTDPEAPASLREFQVLTLNSSADGGDIYVRKYQPDWGMQDNEITVTGMVFVFNVYIKFNIPQNPSGKQIEHATVRLYMFENVHPKTEETISVYRVLSDWDESTITYNTRPLSESEAAVQVPIIQSNGWVSIDITDLARSWMNDGESNFGILLTMPEKSNYPDDRKRFYSKEEVVNASLRPKMRIVYSE
ncbi:MAG: DNRLRE domain-containing protein [Candidatus Auribacterota bacterium]